MNPIVVLPVCPPDAHIALKWIAWAKWLQSQTIAPPYTLVVFVAKSVQGAPFDALRDAIADWPSATLAQNPEYYERHDLGYAACANQQFHAGLEYAERQWPMRPILWCEPDCVPCHPRWFTDIAAEYATCGRAVLGDFHAPSSVPHVSGNAVYPANWRTLIPSFALLPGPIPEQGWDSQCAHETVPLSHRSCRIQQVWMVPMPKFTERNINMVHQSTALWHRCKDGSLIDVLSKRLGGPSIPLVEPFAKPAPMYARAALEAAERVFLPPKSTTYLYCVSCRRDAEMLTYLVNSVEKYATGFGGFVVNVPVKDARYFRHIEDKVTLTTFDEAPGKGFLHHMIMKVRADEVLPHAEHVVLLDSDCLFWQPVTPADYIIDGQALMVRERYEEVGRRNENRLIWQRCVEAATGIRPVWEAMTRHPAVYPREIFAHTRTAVENHVRMPFDEYVFSRENAFPQGFCELNTLAAVAIRDMPDRFNFVDYDWERDRAECGVATRDHQYIYRPGRERLVEGWSHSGIGRYKNDWDKFMNGQLPKFYLK